MDTRRIKNHFRRTDPVVFAAMNEMDFGRLGSKQQPPSKYFAHLCREIIGQQLAGSAANAIHKRFLTLFPRGRVTAKGVGALSEQKLRNIGLSWAKARYIRDLARQVTARTVLLVRLPSLEDEVAIAELTKVKGIGRWTAEMFLMFTLGREDVFSPGDLGLQKGLEHLYGAARTRTPEHVERITAKWSPYRSYGSLALWHAYDSHKAAKKLAKTDRRKAS